MENIIINVDLVRSCIEKNYNRYFKCSDIVNDIIAIQNGTTIKYLMDCCKCSYDPFNQYRRSLSVKVGKRLSVLRNEGFIEKYGARSWRKRK